MKIKTNIIILSAIFFILLMGASSFVSTQLSFNIILDRIKNKEAPANAKYIAESFDKKASKAISLGKIVGDNPFVYDWLKQEKSEESPEKIKACFAKFVSEGLFWFYCIW